MSHESRIYAALSAHAGLTNLVATRISAGIAQQGTERPYLTYQIIGARPEYTHDGPEPLTDPEFQFDCWGDTFDSARAVNAAVLDALTAAESPTNLWVIIEDDGTYMYERESQFHRFMVRARVWTI